MLGAVTGPCRGILACWASDLLNSLQGRNVLKKEPMGKDISETDVFSFNEEFHNKLYKIKIATVSAQKESEPEKIETRHKVSQHRCHLLLCIRPLH